MFPTEREIYFSNYSCVVGEMKIQALRYYTAEIFSSQSSLQKRIDVKRQQAGIEFSIHVLYQHSLFLSNIAGLKPGRLKCLHFVSGAQADHPLGPLIFFTDADKLTVKHTRCAQLIQHARLLLSAPRQPWLHDSPGTLNC